MIWLLLAASLDSDIDSLRQRTAELEPRVQILHSSYLQVEAFDREATVKQRINEGETLYLLGDYARASVLLFDVVTEPRNIVHPDYDLALFYLAETSYLARNIIGARHYFQQLITRGNDKHLFDAFERLIQIADRLQDYAGVEAQVDELKKAGKGALRPDVAYLYGKSLTRRAKSELALSYLYSVPVDHKYYFRARYVIGAELALAGKYDDAVKCFAEIIASEHPLGLGAPASEERNFKEIAELGRGRVYAELGLLDRAMEAYAAIAKDSPHLTEALYEIAWMHVQAQSYRRALQAIDILLLAQNDRLLTPKAQLLKGNVLLKLGRMSDAIDAFNRVNEVYEPVYRELSTTLTNQKDPERYFNEVITKNQGVYNAGAFLPPLAVAWVGDEREVGRAIGMANDLLNGKQDIDESKQIGARVLTAIASKAPVELFPLFAEGERRAGDADRDLRSALEQLLTLMTRAVGATDDAELAKARAERLKAQTVLLDAKAVNAKITGQDARKRAAVLLLENEVAKIRTEVNGMNARLVALQTFLQNNPSLREQTNNEARVVAELEIAQHAIETELRTLRGQMRPKANEEQIARESYDRAISKELGLLKEKSVSTSIASAPALEKLDILRDRLGAVDAGLRSFRERAFGVVDKRAVQIASRVEAELKEVAKYEAELSVVQRDSSKLIGRIAHRSFEDVRKKFYDLVLKADVGLIDVVWKEKDERTETINVLVKAQKDAIQALDHDFEELFTK